MSIPNLTKHDSTLIDSIYLQWMANNIPRRQSTLIKDLIEHVIRKCRPGLYDPFIGKFSPNKEELPIIDTTCKVVALPPPRASGKSTDGVSEGEGTPLPETAKNPLTVREKASEDKDLEKHLKELNHIPYY